MGNTLIESLNQDCLFRTERISVLNWNYIEASTSSFLAESVLKIMTPNVTKALPDDWQKIDSINTANNWISERKQDCNFFALANSETDELFGFLFLYRVDETFGSMMLRLGYLLSESKWGKGLGSELIKGLVDWCKTSNVVKSISGGVQKDNFGSIKVLEKNGFTRSQEELPGGMLLYIQNF